MKSNDLTVQQRESLIELLVLGMYADGHLAAVEEAMLQKAAEQLGYQEAYDRNRVIDAAITRVSRLPQTPELIRTHVISLGRSFEKGENRRSGFRMVEELLASDDRVTSEESQFLALLREAVEI